MSGVSERKDHLDVMLADDGQANECRHDSATGIDQTEVTDPAKAWRCDHCALRWRVDGRAVAPDSPECDGAATPTLERVRTKFATVLDDTAGWKYSDEWGRDFDRWLAARDAAIRADIAAEVLAPIEALIETDGVFLKKDTKIKRVQEDRRRDLGAIVTTSMVTVDDIRAALSTAKEASE